MFHQKNWIILFTNLLNLQLVVHKCLEVIFSSKMEIQYTVHWVQCRSVGALYLYLLNGTRYRKNSNGSQFGGDMAFYIVHQNNTKKHELLQKPKNLYVSVLTQNSNRFELEASSRCTKKSFSTINTSKTGKGKKIFLWCSSNV